jgi:DNA primase
VGNYEGKAALEALALPLIFKIPDESLQSQLLKLLEQKTGVYKKPVVNKEDNRALQPHRELKRTPMREVIALLLQNPSYAQRVPDLSSVKTLQIPGLILLIEVVENCRNYPHITTGQLLEYWRDHKNEPLVSRLASWEIHMNDENQEELFLDSLDKILAQCIEKQIENLQAKERSVGLSSDEKRELLALMLDLKA